MESIKLCVIIFPTNRDYHVLHNTFIVIFKHYWFRSKNVIRLSFTNILKTLNFKVAFRWKHIVLESDRKKLMLVVIKRTSIK
jgi:hypothetical protein